MAIPISTLGSDFSMTFNSAQLEECRKAIWEAMALPSYMMQSNLSTSLTFNVTRAEPAPDPIPTIPIPQVTYTIRGLERLDLIGIPSQIELAREYPKDYLVMLRIMVRHILHRTNPLLKNLISMRGLRIAHKLLDHKDRLTFSSCVVILHRAEKLGLELCHHDNPDR